MGANEELGTLLGSIIVSAKHIDAMHDMPVPTDQVGAVFPHRRHQRPPRVDLKYRRKGIMTLRKSAIPSPAGLLCF
jgi:hypothetical protein